MGENTEGKRKTRIYYIEPKNNLNINSHME